MFCLFLLAGAVLLPRPVAAGRPKALGRFADWVAASYDEAGQAVCYAFTRAVSTPGDPDAAAASGAVVLTVTQRPSERDDVAISEGFTLPRDAPFRLIVDGQGFDFYTAQQAAFARDGVAVAAALTKASIVMDHASGSRGTPIADQFSLRGFAAAYAATNQACPEH